MTAKAHSADENFPGPAFGGDPIITALLREAIENDLTAIQSRTVRAVWFDGRRVRDIALLEKVSEQTVRRRLAQSYGKLRSALRYAVRYSQLRGQYDDAA